MSEHKIGDLVAGATYEAEGQVIIAGVIVAIRKDSAGTNIRYDIEWTNGHDICHGYTKTDVDGFKEILQWNIE